jgi:putative NADH-flavin reductase
MKVCILGASGKLGQYMVQHALDRGYEVVAVCRAESVGKLEAVRRPDHALPGDTNDRDVISARWRGATGCSPSSSRGA